VARRAREHRKDIPGYDESRPDRDERKRQHRQVRHAAHQALANLSDPDDLTLPDVPRRGRSDLNHSSDAPPRRRFRVWKTKFWKRRDNYQDLKARIDSNWPVITSYQLEDR
jgi:hypothetical protein